MTRILTEAETITKLPDFHWTLERYHAAIAAGVFSDDDKVELLFGKIVPTSPIGVLHGKAVKHLARYFIERFPQENYTIGVQDPVTLVDDSEPKPDLFVAQGPLVNYDHHPHPEDLLLVVEVSDSTLLRDRTAKKFSYAVAGVVEYWIVTVYEKQVERFTDPRPAEGTYTKQEIIKAGETFTSLHLGNFTVDDLLVASA
ncbi:Uma2 family endonuclease [Lewinella aquimaris]|uniref:Uma2 family endonuclease n=1 Tax=Neolewinella aquimaris TaxID=1835722 RepID=A0A840EA63_9BACT|nr:Uma2 family endonuclease [Neolewinella aquimaris]MBB4080833.1 Uma2 family endonuclease [Neolewinella aquimaris]